MKLIDADKLEDELIDSVYDNSSALHILWEQPTVCYIEQIRAEIEFEVVHRTNMLCAEDVFEIIDKYTKGESE